MSFLAFPVFWLLYPCFPSLLYLKVLYIISKAIPGHYPE
jgi:hypothetical protein